MTDVEVEQSLQQLRKVREEIAAAKAIEGQILDRLVRYRIKHEMHETHFTWERHTPQEGDDRER